VGSRRPATMVLKIDLDAAIEPIRNPVIGGPLF